MLSDEVQTILQSCSYVKRYNLSVMEIMDSVVLVGKVESYFHKQMAQEVVGKFIKSKGKLLRNNIIVEK